MQHLMQYNDGSQLMAKIIFCEKQINEIIAIIIAFEILALVYNMYIHLPHCLH